MAFKASLLLLLQLSLLAAGVTSDDVVFLIDNQCPNSIWLGSNMPTGDTDSEILADTIKLFTMPDPWNGSLWARTNCSYDGNFNFSCETGDCGSGSVNCDCSPPALPVTLLNFAINQSVLYYELSLKHGFNIRARIQPDDGFLVDGGFGACPAVDCVQDLADACPSVLAATNKNGAYVGCYSACDRLGKQKYCCNSSDCEPDKYSNRFKHLCPLAHTYHGDNSPPMYGCAGFNAINVTFCPII